MATVFRLPDIGEGLTEAEIVLWHADVGDEVVADRPLVTVETDKTQADLPAPVTGTLLHRGAPDGATLEVGAVLAVIGAPGESWMPQTDDDWDLVPVAEPEPEAEPEPVAAVPATGAPLALPLVRRMARELGVDLAAIDGSGPEGRVTRDDVRRAAEAPTRVPAERPPLVGTLDEVAEDLSAPVAPPPVSQEPAAEAPAGDRLVPLTATRRAIADHMVRSWTEVPHVTTFGDFDAARLLEVRRALAARHGVPIPLDALVALAVAPALAAHPEFNATLRDDGLLIHGAVHLGVAMDSDDGLLVGVVRDMATRSLLDVAREIGGLAERARSRSLSREDMTGATFTVSNIGAVGGGHGTPIIPHGTTAILSVGRAADRPVVRNGELAVGTVAPLSLSYDHRVVDGALGRRFLALVVENLEEPALFLA